MALRSSVWDFFTKIHDEKVKCNLCSAVLSFKSSSTSCLNRHLRVKHPTVNLNETRLKPICMNVNSDIASSTSTATVQEPVISVLVRQDEQCVQQIPSTSVQQIPSTSTGSVVNRCARQTKISGFASRPIPSSKRAKIDEQILRLIVKEYLPFNVVESVEFRKMTYLLNENYVPPSRKTLSSSLLSQVYDKTLVEVRSAVQAALQLMAGHR